MNTVFHQKLEYKVAMTSPRNANLGFDQSLDKYPCVFRDIIEIIIILFFCKNIFHLQ